MPDNPASMIADVPGYRDRIVETTLSRASNGADNLYQRIVRIPRQSNFKSAYWFSDTDWTWTAGNYRVLLVQNLGTAGAGTTVLATYTPTVSIAAGTILTLTNGSTLTLAAGELLAFNTSKVSTPQDDLPAGVCQLEFA